MPPVGRTCSECNASLSDRSVRAKTCSDKCRWQRSRRIRRANKDVHELEEHYGGASEIAAIVRRESPDVITRVMKEELAPIVRESLTEDVLRAVQGMVNLTPAAVEALQTDLESDDKTIRQRAYTLIIKYTVGHPSLVKPEDADGSNQLVVNFNLPRPEDEPTTVDAEAEEERFFECDICHETKPDSERASGSDRCVGCLDEWKARVLEEINQ